MPRELETRLKQEASRQRVTLSHLVRSLLEDTVALVDGVLESVDEIVADSVGLAESVGRDALRLARTASRESRRVVEEVREGRARGEPDAMPSHLAHVDAWNPVILNQPVNCAQCDREIGRGGQGYLGLAQDQGVRPRVWLCSRCIGEL